MTFKKPNYHEDIQETRKLQASYFRDLKKAMKEKDYSHVKHFCEMFNFWGQEVKYWQMMANRQDRTR